MFAEISYFNPKEDIKITFSYDREEHNLSGSVKEKKDEAKLGIDIKLTKNPEVNTSYSYGRINNFGGISSNNEKINMLYGAINYIF